jgi:tetratricopeptide (TPR) repeat protein
MDRGDTAWERRTEGYEGLRARPEPVTEAVAAYEAALEAAPESLEAHWKLVRALYFQGEYAVEGSAEKQKVYSRATEVFGAAAQRLQERFGTKVNFLEGKPEDIARTLAGVGEAPALYFWAAVAWGSWGEVHGRLAAVRQGVATRVRDYAEVVVLLDETFEEAGGHRILGRLHAVAPSVIFFTGWIDRDKAVEHLTRAVELGPENPDNQVFFADALLEHRKARKAEALQILRRVLAGPVPEGREMEMERSRETARELLETHG